MPPAARVSVKLAPRKTAFVKSAPEKSAPSNVPDDSHAPPTLSNPLDDLEAVTDAAEIRKLSGIVAQVYVSSAVQKYAVALTSATRRSSDLTLGASPRATLHLVRAAKARAAMAGRDYVLPDDLRSLSQPVLAHRLLPSVEAAMSGRSTTDILDAIVAAVPVPGGAPTA
jgi:MoxR-like ATPase